MTDKKNPDSQRYQITTRLIYDILNQKLFIFWYVLRESCIVNLLYGDIGTVNSAKQKTTNVFADFFHSFAYLSSYKNFT